MAFNFENFVFGEHTPLVLRWSDDQLREIAERLAPFLPDSVTEDMQFAVASIARSIVVDQRITGQGVHYSRKKNVYSRPERYRNGDPRFTWFYMTKGMDYLHSAGLIKHALGEWFPDSKGRQSVAWATEGLVDLIGPLVDVSEPRAIPGRVETIVLRDADKTEIDYTETADTIVMREQMQFLNEHLAQLDLRKNGQKFEIPLGRRIFNGSFERGGRFYCHGESFQNLPSDERADLELIIDGTSHQMVEIDYSGLHPAMAYAEAGVPMPDDDPYDIDGFDRALVKLAVNTLFNAATTGKAILAIAKKLRETTRSTHCACRHLAERVVAAIQDKHSQIKDYFGSDCGARFQRRDSEMAIEVMARMIQRTGRCPLPVHDSFLVARIDSDVLSQTMTEVAREQGLQGVLKESVLEPGPALRAAGPIEGKEDRRCLQQAESSESRYVSRSSGLFHMGYTASDLRFYYQQSVDQSKHVFPGRGDRPITPLEAARRRHGAAHFLE
jgi:hypothetical protein